MAVNVIVVGGGVWGASAREHFLKAGRSVTWIIDDKESAASDDIARIIRAEYADPAYRDLADRALTIFRTQEPYSTYFHEPGWYLLQSPQDLLVHSIPAGAEKVAVEVFLQDFPEADVGQDQNITHTNGVGWVEANNLQRALRNGSDIHYGSVTRLLCNGTTCYGVKVGEAQFLGDPVILATGWRTNKLLRSNHLPPMAYDIVGAAVLGIQLDEAQYAKYKQIKILCDPERGEILPPTPERIMRINNPRTFLFDSSTVKAPIVESTHECFKETWDFLREYCPDLTKCPVVIAKVCLDALTESQSFYIEPAVGIGNLCCIGGGSFHSWKFRPVLSDLIGSRLKFRDERWTALNRSQSKKHAGVIPQRSWKSSWWTTQG